jgi:hypothetical protein
MLKETDLQRLDEAKAKPNYPREVVQRYREMAEKHAFARQIKKRVPVDLNTDKVPLSCGHKLETMASLINATAAKLLYRECQKQWLAEAVEEAKKQRRMKQGGSDK